MDIVILLVLFLGACAIFYVSIQRALAVNDTLTKNVASLEEELSGVYKVNADYETWFNEFKVRVIDSYQRLRMIDASGHFKADDEVGYFFEELKSIIERLYELGIVDETEKQESRQGMPKITTDELQKVLSQRKTTVSTREEK